MTKVRMATDEEQEGFRRLREQVFAYSLEPFLVMREDFGWHCIEEYEAELEGERGVVVLQDEGGYTWVKGS